MLEIIFWCLLGSFIVGAIDGAAEQESFFKALICFGIFWGILYCFVMLIFWLIS